jgi:phosphoribosylaminoimidazolecarboxamide formyltransferase / IMP cyclohydrolase
LKWSANSMTHPIRTALLSVSDKTGIVPFARALVEEFGVKLLSTGGTAALLRAEGLPVTDVSDHTGFPEMMDGRIKTLHPLIHGGLLGRRGVDDAVMDEHGIEGIDLVVVNLYPFEATIARCAGYEESIENIDIGGPAMVRSAAKNHAHVTIASDPSDYDAILSALKQGGGATTLPLRQELAYKAFSRTAQYDAAISRWFAGVLEQPFPSLLGLPMQLIQSLRYGENPHQDAAFYRSNALQGTLAAAEQLQGKELSFNNINDTDAAWALVSEFSEPAIAIIKHANPCGVAVAETLEAAYSRALACDPQSAYGGIIAANQRITEAAADAMATLFAEVIIAPAFDEAALEVLAKKKNLRLLHTDGVMLPSVATAELRSVSGGYLVQTRDDKVLDGALQHVSKRVPTQQETQDMILAFTVAKHVKSNAIVLVKDGATIGIGAGQMSRVDSVRVACQKAAAAGLETRGAVLASDAFFPFDDNVHQAATAGIAAIIQPGGSIRDAEVIAASDQYNMSLSFTGIRHFKH